MERDTNTVYGYATLELKAFGGDDKRKGFIAGRASHIAPDRGGDIIVPSGLKFRLPIPMRHEHRVTVGHITAATVTDKGLDVEGQLVDPDEAESQTIRERLLAAWDVVRLKLARGFSVGLVPRKSERISPESFGRRYLEAELFEVSIVEVPANARATISVVKSFAQQSVPRDYSRLDPELVRRITRSDGAVHL